MIDISGIAAKFRISPAMLTRPNKRAPIGASNTHGWYVGNQGAYPARLQELLKAKGIDARVVNAGVPFDTTAGMLRSLGADVALSREAMALYPFCRLTAPANVLVMPAAHSASISTTFGPPCSIRTWSENGAPVRTGRRGRPRWKPRAVIADKAYSAAWLLEALRREAIVPVIPSRSDQPENPDFDLEVYRDLNLVERLVG